MTTITDKLADFDKALAAMPDGAYVIPGWDVYSVRKALAPCFSQQAEPSSGSSAAAPVVAGPSDARVEAAARVLAACLGDARAVLQAADAVSAVAVPDGFVLVREKATPLIREALRIGMRREVPNDELCDIRWRAAIAAAAPGSEQKEGAR